MSAKAKWRSPSENAKILDLLDFEPNDYDTGGQKRGKIGRPRKWCPELLIRGYQKYITSSNVCKKSISDFVKRIGMSRRNYYYLIKCARTKNLKE